MSFPRVHNIGAFIAALKAAVITSLTAGGTGDNTAIVGAIIDRAAYNYPQSLTAVVLFDASLTAAKTLSLKSVILETGDVSTLSDATTLSAPADAVVASATGTNTGQKEYDIDLAGAKRYIRLTFTPDLSHTSTDTATVAAALILGGTDTVPV